jgi:hypothetical protein
MIRRRAEGGEASYRARYRSEQWEVPLVEVVEVSDERRAKAQ